MMLIANTEHLPFAERSGAQDFPHPAQQAQAVCVEAAREATPAGVGARHVQLGIGIFCKCFTPLGSSPRNNSDIFGHGEQHQALKNLP
jgi:hypothetical protein